MKILSLQRDIRVRAHLPVRGSEAEHTVEVGDDVDGGARQQRNGDLVGHPTFLSAIPIRHPRDVYRANPGWRTSSDARSWRVSRTTETAEPGSAVRRRW